MSGGDDLAEISRLLAQPVGIMKQAQGLASSMKAIEQVVGASGFRRRAAIVRHMAVCAPGARSVPGCLAQPPRASCMAA